MGSRMRRLIAGALVLAQGPAVVTAMAALSQADHRWPDLLVQFTAPVLAASLALTLLALLVRSRVAAGVGSLCGLALIAALWPQIAPEGRARPATGETVRVYSANVWARNTDVEAMARSIRQADADILVLVEVGEAPAADIENLLSGHPYRFHRGSQGRRAAPAQLVIASRWPLRDGGHDRSHVISWTTVATPIGPVTVAGVHLTRPWPFFPQEAQLQQVEALAGRLERFETPVIVAGDFNSVSSGRVGRRVRRAGLVPVPGWPGTWPAIVPAAVGMTIDQVYHSRDLAVVSRLLGQPTGSDHRPVITVFATGLPRRPGLPNATGAPSRGSPRRSIEPRTP